MRGGWLSGLGSFGGGVFGAGCPVCVLAMGALFSSLGLGFLVNMKLLVWITLVFLLIGMLGLYANFRSHGKEGFLLIGFLASLAVFGGRYIISSDVLTYSGTAVMICNAFLDFRRTKRVACRIRK